MSIRQPPHPRIVSVIEEANDANTVAPDRDEKIDINLRTTYQHGFVFYSLTLFFL